MTSSGLDNLYPMISIAYQLSAVQWVSRDWVIWWSLQLRLRNQRIWTRSLWLSSFGVHIFNAPIHMCKCVIHTLKALCFILVCHCASTTCIALYERSHPTHPVVYSTTYFLEYNPRVIWFFSQLGCEFYSLAGYINFYTSWAKMMLRSL